MLEFLEEILGYTRGYTELRFHKRKRLALLSRNGNLEQADSTIYSGVGIRVLLNGAWGFSSSSRVDKESVLKVLREAEAAALNAGEKKITKIRGLGKVVPVKGSFKPKISDPLTNHSIEEKVNLIMDTEHKARMASPLVKSVSCGYTELLDEKWILTTDGTKVSLLDSKPEFRLTVVAMRGHDMMAATQAIGVTGGWSDLWLQKSPEELSEKAVKLSCDLLKASHPEGGEATVVLDPDLVGTLAHEAIGHTVEADFVLSGSAARGKIGKKVASPLVTLVDSGTSEIKPCASGTIFVDDEGVKAKKTTIIENGVMRSYLHNRESAYLFGVEPTGNARAWEYSDEPLIRMRNTYIEPGESTLEELIGGIKKGYLLKGLEGGGQADANAEFMFGVKEAYRVKNGKIGELVRGASISGNAFNVLRGVDAVGNQFRWGLGAGHCGKKQLAKVDGGGPYIRCKIKIGGKQR